MAVILALPKLFDDVVARFASESIAVPNAFGWREPSRQLGGPTRIVWVPGDENGSLGEVQPARQAGRNPRPLATLAELFTVYIESANISSPENERAQYQAARELFDTWWRAVHLAARGTVAIESVTWITGKTERRFGAALRVVCTIDAMIPDTEDAVATVPTRAVIETAELDYSETIETAPAP